MEQQEETDISDISTSPSEPSDIIDDVDDHYDHIASSIQPYAFKPMVDASDITEKNGSGGGGEEGERAYGNDGIWCRCGKCKNENREVDRMCCSDLDIPNV